MTELIDCHAHVYHRNLPFAPSAWHLPEHDAPHQDLAHTLATNNVTAAVLAAASILDDNNGYALEAVAEHRNWRTTVIAKPGIDMATLADWNRKGAVGIRLQCMHHPLPDFTTRDYQTLFRAVSDLGWHIHIHDHGERLAVILPSLMATGARIVVDHFGRPEPETGRRGNGYQAMLRAAETGKLWIKLSAGFRLASERFAGEMAGHLISDFGPERLVWGSDWPFAGFEKTLDYASARLSFDQWVPAPLREQIGHLTPLDLYFG